MAQVPFEYVATLRQSGPTHSSENGLVFFCFRIFRIKGFLILQIVEVVLRQGLVHPITCVPYLIALETDPLESNSKLAHHLLMNMNEKYISCI